MWSVWNSGEFLYILKIKKKEQHFFSLFNWLYYFIFILFPTWFLIEHFFSLSLSSLKISWFVLLCFLAFVVVVIAIFDNEWNEALKKKVKERERERENFNLGGKKLKLNWLRA